MEVSFSRRHLFCGHAAQCLSPGMVHEGVADEEKGRSNLKILGKEEDSGMSFM